MTEDAAILDWLERQHTLHRSVEAAYVVDGYEVAVLYDGTPIPGLLWRGATLRAAYTAAMDEWDTTHGNRNLLAEQRKAP